MPLPKKPLAMIKVPASGLGHKPLPGKAPVLPRTGTGVKPPPAKAAPVEDKKPRTVTVRMPPNVMGKLESNMATLEVEKSEAIKRAVSFHHLALSGHSVQLIIRDEAGRTETHTVMKEGMPV